MQMECDQNGDADDGHVNAKLEPRKKGPLVGTVVSCITGGVFEEEWPKVRLRKEDVTGSDSDGDRVSIEQSYFKRGGGALFYIDRPRTQRSSEVRKAAICILHLPQSSRSGCQVSIGNGGSSNLQSSRGPTARLPEFMEVGK